MSEIIQAFIVAALSKTLPALGSLIDGSDHPFAERVRSLRPKVWATDLAEQELLKILEKTDAAPDTSRGPG